ncbi:hypothetical protein E2C01_057525 [Portunus trituberculatus]|uniref:Uncharacterized protein n=1 Tax=Portunus trituberculatus TaxID=210409 RepID=A0A5B7H2U4_PORTR|nr:hypothetical protein [Portunus trituberculatus]
MRPRQEHGVRYVHSKQTVVKEWSWWAERVGLWGRGTTPVFFTLSPTTLGLGVTTIYGQVTSVPLYSSVM